MFDPKQPFNDLPLLPPSVDVETKAVLKACIGANKALAELKGAGDLIPNQAMLINAIPLQEARDSSAIENIVTTKDKLFLAAADPSSANDDPSTKEVLRYRTALNHGANGIHAEGLSVRLLCSVCGQLRDQKVELRDQEPVIIGNRVTRTVTYTPPRGQPYCKIQFVVDANLAERKTASNYLQELESIGILTGEKVGREVIYRHPALLEVLSE